MEPKIIQKNLKEQIHSILKQRICTGYYPPGARLVIDTLAEEYNVSRTPIRDVLHSMTPNGLISQQGKGYVIFDPTIDEVKDISLLRLELEKMAVEQCTLRGTDDDLQKFNYYKKMKIKNISEISLKEYDVTFHDMILKYSRNKYLTVHLRMIQDLWWLIRHWTQDETTFDIKKVSINQHIEIIDAMMSRDVERAKSLMEQHHNTGLDSIIGASLFANKQSE